MGKVLGILKTASQAGRMFDLTELGRTEAHEAGKLLREVWVMILISLIPLYEARHQNAWNCSGGNGSRMAAGNPRMGN